MGDAVLVAVPVISVMAVAVALILRGSRQSKSKVKAAKALWKVRTEPNAGGVVIYLYKEVDGDVVERETYARIERSVENYEDRLFALRGAAELEASLLNDGID